MQVLSNVMSRVILSIVYFLIVPPFAYLVRYFRDPLAVHESSQGSFWHIRPLNDTAARDESTQNPALIDSLRSLS